MKNILTFFFFFIQNVHFFLKISRTFVLEHYEVCWIGFMLVEFSDVFKRVERLCSSQSSAGFKPGCVIWVKVSLSFPGASIEVLTQLPPLHSSL